MKVNPDTICRQFNLACGMWKHRCASGFCIRSGGIFGFYHVIHQIPNFSGILLILELIRFLLWFYEADLSLHEVRLITLIGMSYLSPLNRELKDKSPKKKLTLFLFT